MSIPAALPGQVPLETHDPDLFDLIEREKHRQWSCLELIASENITSRAVLDCLGSALTNKVECAIYYPRLNISFILLCRGSTLKDTLARDIMAAMSLSMMSSVCAKNEL